MLSERKKKLLTSLQYKKFRLKHGMFLLEGEKMITDAIQHSATNTIRLTEIFATENWIGRSIGLTANAGVPIETVSRGDIRKITSLVTPQEVIATANLPGKRFNEEMLTGDVVLVLDRVRDPGNLGTIIRSADWFGFQTIICSKDTVDAFNMKAVQASMGAILRVHVIYEELDEVFELARKHGIPIVGTTLGGENLYSAELSAPMLLVAGNESAGISPGILSLLDREITIPPDDPEGGASESLNVAMAVSIVCAEIRRRRRQG